MNPKKILHNTTFSVRLSYIACHSFNPRKQNVFYLNKKCFLPQYLSNKDFKGTVVIRSLSSLLLYEEFNNLNKKFYVV